MHPATAPRPPCSPAVQQRPLRRQGREQKPHRASSARAGRVKCPAGGSQAWVRPQGGGPGGGPRLHYIPHRSDHSGPHGSQPGDKCNKAKPDHATSLQGQGDPLQDPASPRTDAGTRVRSQRTSVHSTVRERGWASYVLFTQSLVLARVRPLVLAPRRVLGSAALHARSTALLFSLPGGARLPCCEQRVGTTSPDSLAQLPAL